MRDSEMKKMLNKGEVHCRARDVEGVDQASKDERGDCHLSGELTWGKMESQKWGGTGGRENQAEKRYRLPVAQQVSQPRGLLTNRS